MKYSRLLVFSILFLHACKGGVKNSPDVSGIKVDTHIERFDRDYFSLDSNRLDSGLKTLSARYPYFINDFTANILGAGLMNDTNEVLRSANRHFFTSYYQVYTSTKKQFDDLSAVEKELNSGFRYIKYYFPRYEVPKFISYLGPFDAPGAAITESAVAIGLQLYAGQDFPFYTSVEGQQLFPAYISKRFEKAYIPANCVKVVLEDIYPDRSEAQPLIGQMIWKGKYWWLTSRMLRETADSIITGYSSKQLEWCRENEGTIWNLLLQNDHLYSTEPAIIQMYIGDAPTTQGFPSLSPGNIGQWIGMRIIEAYIEKNPSVTPEQLLALSPGEIFEAAKYKPR